MKNIYLFLLLLLPFGGVAQQLDADALLDKVVATMKNDAPLQMDYSYIVYDDDNTVVLRDKGVMRLDGNRYSLVMDKWACGVMVKRNGAICLILMKYILPMHRPMRRRISLLCLL